MKTNPAIVCAMALVLGGCRTAPSLRTDIFAGVHLSDRLEKILTEPIEQWETGSAIAHDIAGNPDCPKPVVFDHELLHPAKRAPNSDMVLRNTTLKEVLSLRCPEAYVVPDPWGNLLYLASSRDNAARARRLGAELKKYDFEPSLTANASLKTTSIRDGFYACYRHACVNDVLKSDLGFGECGLKIESALPDSAVVREMELWHRVPAASGLWAVLVLSPTDVNVSSNSIQVIPAAGRKHSIPNTSTAQIIEECRKESGLDCISAASWKRAIIKDKSEVAFHNLALRIPLTKEEYEMLQAHPLLDCWEVGGPAQEPLMRTLGYDGGDAAILPANAEKELRYIYWRAGTCARLYLITTSGEAHYLYYSHVHIFR